MNAKTLCLSITAACLLNACERVGNDARLPAPTIERAASAQPAAVQSPNEAPPAAAARAEMPAAEALTDPAITRRIQLALQADPAMSGADVSINTDKGVVVLSGTVTSHEQTGIASAHAQRQDGVLRVDNHLRPAVS